MSTSDPQNQIATAKREESDDVFAHPNTLLGDELFDSEDYSAAETHYHQVTLEFPNSGTAWYNLARTYRALGERDEAMIAVQKALLVDKPEPEFYHLVGNLYRDGGLAQQAISAYERALELDETFDAHNNLALSYKDLGKFDLAKGTLEKGLLFQPDDWYLRANLGSILYDLEDYAGAVMQLQKAVTLKRESWEDWSLLAGALRNCKRFDEALSAMNESIRLNPNDAEEYRNLGNIYRDMGDHKRAEHAFLLSLSQDPSLVDSMVLLALTQAETDQIESAEKMLNNALVAAGPEHISEIAGHLDYVRQLGHKGDHSNAAD